MHTNALENAWQIISQLHPYLQLCIEDGEFTLPQRDLLQSILTQAFDPKSMFRVSSTGDRALEKLLGELGQETADKRAYRYYTVSRIKSLLSALQLIFAARSYRPPQPHDYYALELWQMVLHLAGDCETIFAVIGSSGYSERVRVHVEQVIKPRNLTGTWAIHTHNNPCSLYRAFGSVKIGGPANVELPELHKQMRWVGGQHGMWDLKV